MYSGGRFRLFLVIMSGLVSVAVIVYALRWSSPDSSNHLGASTSRSRVKPTLKFVIVVNRHGNRGPMFTFPKNPFRPENKTVWPYGQSQLTQGGRRQMYHLGLKIRSLYDGYLNKYYYPEVFRAQSTLKDRTLMSAELFLAGLFPPQGFQIWNDKIAWQPVPVFPFIKNHADISPEDSTECPKLMLAVERSEAESEQMNGKGAVAFLNKIFPYTGAVIKPGEAMHLLRSVSDPLLCAAYEGLPLPSWLSSHYLEEMEDGFAKCNKAVSMGSDTMIRLYAGLLFKEFLDLMQSKANQTMSPDTAMHYYSGHDHTILALLAILGAAEPELRAVRPASAVIYELHQHLRTGRYFVQVLYIDGRSSDLEPLAVNIAGCDSPCDFELLKDITKKYYNITDYDKECQLTA